MQDMIVERQRRWIFGHLLLLGVLDFWQFLVRFGHYQVIYGRFQLRNTVVSYIGIFPK
jgi:hypothetical protein